MLNQAAKYVAIWAACSLTVGYLSETVPRSEILFASSRPCYNVVAAMGFMVLAVSSTIEFRTCVVDADCDEHHTNSIRQASPRLFDTAAVER